MNDAFNFNPQAPLTNAPVQPMQFDFGQQEQQLGNWDKFLQNLATDRNLQQSLMVAGAQMMQPGQTTAGAIGAGVSAGVGHYNQSIERDRTTEHRERQLGQGDRRLDQSDEQFEASQEQQRVQNERSSREHNLAERRLMLMEKEARREPTPNLTASERYVKRAREMDAAEGRPVKSEAEYLQEYTTATSVPKVNNNLLQQHKILSQQAFFEAPKYESRYGDKLQKEIGRYYDGSELYRIDQGIPPLSAAGEVDPQVAEREARIQAVLRRHIEEGLHSTPAGRAESKQRFLQYNINGKPIFTEADLQQSDAWIKFMMLGIDAEGTP